MFKPGGASLSGGSLQCNYQYLGAGVNCGYYLIIAGTYRNNNNASGNNVGLFTDSLKIQEGIKYALGSNIKGRALGQYSNYTSTTPYELYRTNDSNYKGELSLKNLTASIKLSAVHFGLMPMGTMKR